MGLKPYFPNFVLKPFAQGLKFLFRRLGAAAVHRNHIGEEEGPQQNREKGYGAHADSVAEAGLKRFNGAGVAATACMGRYRSGSGDPPEDLPGRRNSSAARAAGIKHAGHNAMHPSHARW